jgi:hypothetical protein
MLRPGLPIEALPVLSNVEVVKDTQAIRAIRSKYAPSDGFLVGHFSAHPRNVQPYLAATIPALLADKRVHVMLIGRGSSDFRLAAQCNDVVSRLHGNWQTWLLRPVAAPQRVRLDDTALPGRNHNARAV